MTHNLGLGSKVKHDRYGDGVISGVTLTTYMIFFRNHGEKELARDFEGLEVVEATPQAGDALSLDDVERALAGVLQKFVDFPMMVPLGEKWKGGTIILQPGSSELKGKEIPIDTFFHKIVMVRDRLRVLEQNINSHKVLTDEDKVNLQQYITRVYGSLTTFNVLFKQKEDYFTGESSKD